MTQHANLAPERWAKFTLGQQILQIGAEMQRAMRFLQPSQSTSLLACYERVLRLTDLTVQVQDNPSLRRELLRWRGVIAEKYVNGSSDEAAHREAFRVLLQLHPESAKQIRIIGL